MRSQGGQKRAVLEPPDEEFGVVLIAPDIVQGVGRVNQEGPDGFVNGRDILPAADVIPPVGKPAGREIQSGGHLALQSIPCREDIGRPEDRAIALRSQIGCPSEKQCTLRNVAAETVVERCRVGEGVHVMQPCTRPAGILPLRPHELERAVPRDRRTVIILIRHQVRFGFVGPKVVESLLDEILVHFLPEPSTGGRVEGVDQCARKIAPVREVDHGTPVEVGHEPAIVRERVEVA